MINHLTVDVLSSASSGFTRERDKSVTPAVAVFDEFAQLRSLFHGPLVAKSETMVVNVLELIDVGRMTEVKNRVADERSSSHDRQARGVGSGTTNAATVCCSGWSGLYAVGRGAKLLRPVDRPRHPWYGTSASPPSASCAASSVTR